MAQRITTDKVHVYGPTSGASNSNEKRTSSGAVLKRLLPYLAPFRLQLSFAFVLVIVTALVQAVGPVVIGQAIDFYIVGKDKTAWHAICSSCWVFILWDWSRKADKST